jgi:hypothetical protein
MGNTFRVTAADEVALIERRDEHGVEVHGPHAVVGLLQAEVLIHERVRDVQQPVLKAERPRRRGPLEAEFVGTQTTLVA